MSHISTCGSIRRGDVFEGIAIYNLLRNHPAEITVYIDGVAASMASVVAMAGDRVVMPENAMMMIHKPWGISGGNAGDMRDYADLLDKVETVLVPAYARKTGKSAQEITAMLEDETRWTGKNALSTVLLMNCCHLSQQWRELNRNAQEIFHTCRKPLKE